MKILISLVALFLCCNVMAMRCGTHLINEGDSVERAIALCGTPSFDNYSTVRWDNYQGTGMTYEAHVNAVGMIDSLTYYRTGN